MALNSSRLEPRPGNYYFWHEVCCQS